MFKLFKRKLLRQHRKLISQNEMALRWFEKRETIGLKSGLGSFPTEFDQALSETEVAIRMSYVHLAMGNLLSPDMVSLNLAANKRMRQLYDYFRMSRKEFGRRYGLTNDHHRMATFDKQFQPSEGWSHFLSANGAWQQQAAGVRRAVARDAGLDIGDGELSEEELDAAFRHAAAHDVGLIRED
jgi:hypothetical protein